MSNAVRITPRKDINLDWFAAYDARQAANETARQAKLGGGK